MLKTKTLLVACFLFNILADVSALDGSVALPADSIIEKKLQEVEVTAFRHISNLRDVPAPVRIISSEAINRHDAGELSLVLNAVPGVILQQGTLQTNKLTIRGIGSRSPYSTTRTRAYWDDIPLTTGEGVTVLDDVEISFAERVEITKGPHSAWYGSGLGGVLRFVGMKRPEADAQASTQTSLGSYGFQKYQIQSQFELYAGYFNFGLARVAGDGYRENSSFFRNSLMLSGAYEGKTNLSYVAMLSDVKAFTPSSVDESTFLNTPEKAAANWLQVKGFKQYRRLSAGVKAETPINNQWRHVATFSGSVYDQYELRPFNILDDRSFASSVVNQLNYRGTGYAVSAGIEWLLDSYQWDILSNVGNIRQQEAVNLRNQLNAFVSYEQRFGSMFLLNASANVNQTRTELKDFMNPESGLDGNYRTKVIVSPHVGLRFRPDRQMSFYLSAGHGFSNPTSEESLSSDGKLNVLLQPEQGWTFDLGGNLSGKDGRWLIDFSAYYIRLHDLLVTRRITEDVFFGANAGSAALKGVELGMNYNPFPSLLSTLTASLSENKFISYVSDEGAFSGNHLPGIPVASLSASLQGTVLKYLQWNADYTYTGRQYLNDANTLRYNSWNRVDLRLAHTLQLERRYHLQTSISCQNVFNEHYASMLLINAPSFAGRAPRYYYPAMPRHFLFTVKLLMQ